MALCCFVLLGSLAASALAQGQTVIPEPLSSAFSDSLQLELNFQGQRFNGVQDGTTLSTAEVATPPVFNLGDSSGINTAIQFVILMVDSTDPNSLVLHFAQDQFQADGEKTGISSQAPPLLAYKPPGSMGETGERQYSFLLFQQPAAGPTTGIPETGTPFDLTQFLQANNMRPAMAGLGIKATAATTTGPNPGNGNQGPPQQSQQTQPPIVTSPPIPAPPPALAPGGGPSVEATPPLPRPVPAPSDPAITTAATSSATSAASLLSTASATVVGKTPRRAAPPAAVALLAAAAAAVYAGSWC